MRVWASFVKPRRRLRISLLIIAAAYIVPLVAARLAYRRFLYPAPQGELSVPDGTTLLELRASDGVAVHALELGASDRSGKARTIVLFHGNGERMEWGADLGERLRARGLNVVLAEYRGYGRSVGTEPTEEGLYRDAEAVLDALNGQGVKADQIVLWGTSLGTGVAAEMARRGRAAALVLSSPYTSIRAVGSHHAPIFPMRFVLPDAFDTLSRAPLIHVPTLIIHGDKDEVIPYEMGQTLAKTIPGARLITVSGGHHNDLMAVDGEHLIASVVAFAKQSPGGRGDSRE